MSRWLIVVAVSMVLAAGCGSSVPSLAPAPDATPDEAPRNPTAIAPTAMPDAPAVATAMPDAPTDVPAVATDARFELQAFVAGFERPVFASGAGDGSGRIFVVEQPGRILIVRDGVADAEPLLDIRDRVGSEANEQGLLGLAFHPDFGDNGQFFVNYTDRSGDTVIARYQARGDQADPGSERVLMRIEQPYANHNGGMLAFGPDGYLYIGTGDGGAAYDPQGLGQQRGTLLGKILRIDVDATPGYGIPASNPWRDESGRSEVWATGLRNPWRFSFDRLTGDLYIGDVGQDRFEEINREPADSPGGLNYGWARFEGANCIAEPCDTSDVVAPWLSYERGDGCSVTGGYSYRGAAAPALHGVYVYGDYCTGNIWQVAPGGRPVPQLIVASRHNISSFGEDDQGELLVISHSDGAILRLVPAAVAWYDGARGGAERVGRWGGPPAI